MAKQHMRKMAINPDPNARFRRVMIYDPGEGGVYLFLFRLQEDGPCEADYWYEDMAGAEHRAAIELGGIVPNWQTISDPPPGCAQDWIAPMKAIRDERGLPVPGKFEPWTEG